MNDFKHDLELVIPDAVRAVVPDHADTPVALDRPKQAAHGDYASNIALTLAKRAQRNPRELAQALVAALPASALIERAEIAGAGFINFFVTPAARQAIVARVLAERDDFGRSPAHAGERVMVEFVSANPTGPLHVGHGRQAALGDAIASLFESQGYAVTREFYYNDAGQQIQNLALLRARARAGIAGAADRRFPRTATTASTSANWRSATWRKSATICPTWRRSAASPSRNCATSRTATCGRSASRSTIITSRARSTPTVASTRRSRASRRRARPTSTTARCGSKTTDYGDDKDRVMRKSDGSYTYFVPDVAYHVTKWERGFVRVVNVQGSDHHSTVTRVRAGLQAMGLGIPAGYPDYVLHKMVTVMRGGEEVKISKRAGDYVTIRELIDEAGRDAVRFFLVSRKADTEFVFDIDLARSKSDENPVYYVQYAHARVCSVLRQAGMTPDDAVEALGQADMAPLTSPYEEALLRRLADFPGELAAAARDVAPHQVTSYLKELAREFHSYYNAERFLVDDLQLKRARLALALATGQVLKNGLAVLGISAPSQM